MKLIHLSDLHIGKRINDFSLLEDQRYILIKILNIIDEQKPDAVLIAGDVYDKPIPSAEAVQLIDGFLTHLADRGISVFVISGNHDSAARIAFGSQLMQSRHVYMSPVFKGKLDPIELCDEYGPVDIYLLPFMRPADVRTWFPDEEVTDYNQAMRVVIDRNPIDTAKRNIILAHQFITGAATCESEEIRVGGLDTIDASLFDAFDYVALGHLHGAQHIGRAEVRYCGTPLKYSFSEAQQTKSVTVVEMGEKGTVDISSVPLVPQRDMREIKGPFEKIIAPDVWKGTDTDDYIHVTLTDEVDIMDAIGKLRAVYPNLMRLDYDNKRTREQQDVMTGPDMVQRSPLGLFSEFFEKQNNQPMTPEQEDLVTTLIQSMWGEQT